jgi:small GTP-binding protein
MFYDTPTTIGIDFNMVIWNPREYQDKKSNVNNSIDLSKPDMERESDNKMVNFQIWDTAGSERYGAIARNYCKGVSGAVVVFDVNKPKTAGNIPKWINMCHEHGCRNIIVVGNKSDKIHKIPSFGSSATSSQYDTHPDTNPELYIASLTKSITKIYDCRFIITSAKTGENVDKIFDKLFNDIYLQQISTEITTASDEDYDDDIVLLDDVEKWDHYTTSGSYSSKNKLGINCSYC